MCFCDRYFPIPGGGSGFVKDMGSEMFNFFVVSLPCLSWRGCPQRCLDLSRFSTRWGSESEGLPVPIRVGSFRFHFSITASFDEHRWTSSRRCADVAGSRPPASSSAPALFINLVVTSFIWIRYHSHFDELGWGRCLRGKQQDSKTVVFRRRFVP